VKYMKNYESLIKYNKNKSKLSKIIKKAPKHNPDSE
jgi:hypothetical protein